MHAPTPASRRTVRSAAIRRASIGVVACGMTFGLVGLAACGDDVDEIESPTESVIESTPTVATVMPDGTLVPGQTTPPDATATPLDSVAVDSTIAP